eukprot:3862592-Pleurochrysis_carterae.AAC.1
MWRRPRATRPFASAWWRRAPTATRRIGGDTRRAPTPQAPRTLGTTRCGRSGSQGLLRNT